MGISGAELRSKLDADDVRSAGWVAAGVFAFLVLIGIVYPSHPSLLFLGLITVVLPIATSRITGINQQQMYLGGTAILIVVGVALDTMKQLETQLIMRQYRGFIR